MDMPSRIVEFEEWSKMPRVRDLAKPPRRGDLVVLHSRGKMRLARVTKVGRERIETEYTTPTAIAAVSQSGRSPVVTRKPVRMDDDYLRYAGKPLPTTSASPTPEYRDTLRESR